MGHSMNSYIDFAENDYLFFRQAYDHGYKGGPLASLGQNICERYLKHVVSEYANPETISEIHEKESVLRTHSLSRLMKYISNEMKIEIPEEVECNMDIIDGYYFTTRYPGEDSFIPSERDIDKTNRAVETTRDFVLGICRKMEQDTEEN